MDKTERLDRKLVYTGTVLEIYQDTVRIPNGKISVWDYIGHNGAAAALPVTKDGKIVLVRQWRNAIDRYTYGIPAGGRESLDEPMIECAKRELEEETGYIAKELKPLLSIRSSAAFCNERIQIFLATNLTKKAQSLDEEESIDVKEFELQELLDMIYTGKLEDSKTVSAILAGKEYINGRND